MRKELRLQPSPGRNADAHPIPNPPARATSLRPKATTLAVLGYVALLPALAHANCTTVGSATTCDSSAPSPWTTMIGTGPTTVSGSSVTVGPNAQIVVGDSSAIALGDNATVLVQSGALVQNGAVTSNGTYSTGGNTIDFRNNSTLTVEQGATVLSNGTQGQAEAVNPEGTGNTIVNNGTIRGINSAAIWFQNTSGTNTVINNATGIIQAPNNVMGASGNGAVMFSNRGQVIGNLVFAGGNDTLNMYTGSSVSGTINGGGGANLLTLGGAGSDTLPTKITNFQTLQKQDTGTWTITNSIGAMGITSAEVQQGTLVLTGNNSSYTGTMLVDAAGTLRASAQSLTNAVTDNGLVQFQQDTAGTYSGLISGTGAVEKDGAGTLTLAPTAAAGNTYTGGTILKAGAVSISADRALGGTSGSLTFDGGALQLGSSFDLAATRAVSITSNGGTIDTQGFQSTIAQGITGAGALTKAGSGALVLDGTNGYTGGTTVAAGTLVVGDASNGLIRGAMPQASGATGGGATPAAPFSVTNAYVRPPVPPNDTAAAYFTVYNTTGTPDRLLSVQSGAGEETELHVMQGPTMVDATNGVVIPAHGHLALSVGHGHVMIEGVTTKLRAGQQVIVELDFENAGPVDVSAPVVPLGSPTPSGAPS